MLHDVRVQLAVLVMREVLAIVFLDGPGGYKRQDQHHSGKEQSYLHGQVDLGHTLLSLASQTQQADAVDTGPSAEQEHASEMVPVVLVCCQPRPAKNNLSVSFLAQLDKAFFYLVSPLPPSI